MVLDCWSHQGQRSTSPSRRFFFIWIVPAISICVISHLRILLIFSILSELCCARVGFEGRGHESTSVSRGSGRSRYWRPRLGQRQRAKRQRAKRQRLTASPAHPGKPYGGIFVRFWLLSFEPCFDFLHFFSSNFSLSIPRNETAEFASSERISRE